MPGVDDADLGGQAVPLHAQHVLGVDMVVVARRAQGVHRPLESPVPALLPLPECRPNRLAALVLPGQRATPGDRPQRLSVAEKAYRLVNVAPGQMVVERPDETLVLQDHAPSDE